MSLADAHHRMMTETGDLYCFPGTPLPLHYNRMGLSKSIDWETGVLLKNCVEFFNPETVVELGTFRGYSTAWLILASQLRLSSPTWNQQFTKVHAFEVFDEGEYGRMWYDEFELPKNDFTYHAVPGGIWNFPDQVPEKIDLIFHDTEHSLNPTRQEVEFLAPRLSLGGLMIFDDMKHPDYAAMQNYLSGYFSNNPTFTWSVLPLGHGLGIARKR